MKRDLIVVGGGMAGLSCAWRLNGSGLRPVVLEAAPEAGGNVRSESVDGFLLERGPHTFLSSADQIFRLAAEAGLEDQLIRSRPSASARYIARNGRLHRAPDGMGTAWPPNRFSPDGASPVTRLSVSSNAGSAPRRRE